MDGDPSTSWPGFIADAMLAVATLYVSGQALRGCLKEARAEKLAGPEKDAALADARTFYALASLSKPWVLLLIFAGTLIKVGLSIQPGLWSL